MNSLYQQLQQQTNQKLFTPQNSNNAQQMVEQMIASNPQCRELVQAVKTSQMTPKQFFMQFAKEKGIDIEKFLGSLNKYY
jgi:hypothetical protein